MQETGDAAGTAIAIEQDKVAVSAESRAAKKAFYLPALDGLRFFAFLMVFLHHGLPRVTPHGAATRWYDAFVQAGAYGVPLFYALSAYLITTLLMKEKSQSGAVNVPAFYLRRILRIWPLFFLILILAYWLNPLLENRALTPAMMARFLTFNANLAIAGGAIYPMSMSILWSVCVEEQFYLTWPWANKYLNKKGIGILAAAMIAVGLGFRLMCAIRGASPDQVWFSTFSNLDCFGFGALAALYGSNIKPAPALRWLLIAGAFLGILVVVRYAPITDLKPYISIAHVSRASAFGFMAVAFFCATIVLLIGNADQKIWLGRWPFNDLGRISYGLYCYHELVFSVLGRTMPHTIAERVLALPLTILVAALSFRFIEQPFLRLRHRFQVVRSGALG